MFDFSKIWFITERISNMYSWLKFKILNKN